VSGDFCATLYTFLTCSFNTSSPRAKIFPPPHHFYLVSSLFPTTTSPNFHGSLD